MSSSSDVVCYTRKRLRKSFKQNESNSDCMELLKKDGSLAKKYDSLSKGVAEELSSTKTQNKDKYDHVSGDYFPLLVERINDLAKDDKKSLKHILNEIITYLNAEIDEVDRVVQAMVQSGEMSQENVKERSASLLGKLGKMAQSVDDLLNTAASRCRPMTTEEKIELGKRIRKLPEEALNRVVEIITAGKPESQSSEKITMNLGQLDDAILWRLYYHVEYVLKENSA